jgi:hypothetical protein
MISIVICSRKTTVNFELSENLKCTIGADYELVVIDNSENKLSIFEAYNLGIARSKGNYIAFIHDDILFRSNGWGIVINEVFTKYETVGLLGVAGAKIKTKMPSGWWNCPNEYKEINIIQHLQDNKVEKWEYGFEGYKTAEVVAIDGVFMVLKRECNLSFNEDFKGYHNYDLNISFECVNKGFKIVVTNQILIEHFSNGNINDSWYDSTYKLHKFYQKSLPLMTENSNLDLKDLEFKNGKNFVNHYLKIGTKINSLKIGIQLFLLKPNELYHLKLLKKWMFLDL